MIPMEDRDEQVSEQPPKRKRKSCLDPGEGPLNDPRVSRWAGRKGRKNPRKGTLYDKTKYRPDFDRRLLEAAKTGKAMCRKYAAFLCKVSIPTIGEWLRRYPTFKEAFDAGVEGNTDDVEQSLLERATGYSHPDTHIAVYRGEVIQTPITKKYPPDTDAAKSWLKAKRPDVWRDTLNVEQTGVVEHKIVLFGQHSDPGDPGGGNERE